MAERGIHIEQGSGGVHYAVIDGPITDIHMHPRIFDARFYGQEENPNGKAGIHPYSQAALRGGIVMGLAMPNESVRLPSSAEPDLTEVVPYPITTPDRLMAASSIVIQRSLMKTGIIMGVDPEIIGLGNNDRGRRFNSALSFGRKRGQQRFTIKDIESSFSNRHVQRLTAALKIYGNETTGGYAIPLETIVPVAETWNKHNQGKPVVLHLEDEDVAEVLSEWPPNIPVHVAHVSSQQELEAVISAKEDGKDVSCEATPHHLFLTEKTREALGPLGCMKPSLKTESDRKFLWQHLRHIDIFASDCAPHRHADKFGPDGQGIDNPAFGVTNHDVFMPLFLQAVIEDGLLTETELYERIVSNPIRRFHLPVFFTKTRYELKSTTAEEAGRYTEYGFNPFEKSPETPAMLGKLASMTINGQGSLASLGSDPFILRGQVRPGYNNLLTF